MLRTPKNASVSASCPAHVDISEPVINPALDGKRAALSSARRSLNGRYRQLAERVEASCDALHSDDVELLLQCERDLREREVEFLLNECRWSRYEVEELLGHIVAA